MNDLLIGAIVTTEAIKALDDILNSWMNNDGRDTRITDHQLRYQLANEIDKIVEFDKFSERTQTLGNRSWAVCKDELLSWLIERSQTVGAEQAIQDALAYSTAKEIEVYDFVLLDSICIDNRAFEFCNGVTIAMSEKIPNQKLVAELGRNAFSGVAPGTRVVSILYVSNSQPVSHPTATSEEKGKETYNLYNPKIDDMEDVRLCLTLALPHSSVQGIAYGTFCKDDQPFINPLSGWQRLAPRPDKFSHNLTEIELSAADEILKKWSNLESPLKDELMIPLGRYSNFGSGISDVDKAIELRICIDALFSSKGDNGALAYRAGIRAAHFLGGADKRATFKIIKDAYSIGSHAAHEGKLRREDDIQTLISAADVVRRTFRKIIEDGSVDWKSVELGLHE